MFHYIHLANYYDIKIIILLIALQHLRHLLLLLTNVALNELIGLPDDLPLELLATFHMASLIATTNFDFSPLEITSFTTVQHHEGLVSIICYCTTF